jgi:hypothetical protein
MSRGKIEIGGFLTIISVTDFKKHSYRLSLLFAAQRRESEDRA